MTFSEQQLVQAVKDLDRYDWKKLDDFRDKYLTHTGGGNTQRVCALIDEMMEAGSQA